MSLRIDRVQLDIIINGDQGRIRLRELEDQAARLKKELKKLPEASEEYIRKSAELRKVQAEIDGIIDKIGLTGLTYKELIARQKELNLVMKNLDPRTSQYKELDAQLQKVNARMKELRGGAQTTGLSFSKIADGFNRYFGVITAFMASFTGIIFGFRKVIDTFNQFEERVDNLSALTGLTGKDLDFLSEEAKKMSVSMVEGNIRITQSATGIVDAYTKVGSARPELLKNKEDLASVTQEAMILAAAAKSELQPAVDSLTGVLNQFNAPASESRRIINAIAAGSKEGAGEVPYLTSAIEKSGTIAADAGMSIEELVGTIETLAPRMKEPEMAGRNLKAIILKLQETADDTNPSIVGFSTAIENLGKKNYTAAELTKLFGLENVTAAKILINNIQEMKNYTAAVTGTNVALEQAAINTDNNASKLAQAKNKFELTAIALGEKLAPALTFSTNGFSYLMRATLAIIDVFKEHGRLILSATAGIIAYTIAVNAHTIATKAYELATTIATKATQLFNVVSKAGPWGWIAVAIGAVTSALVFFTKNISVAEKAQKMLNDVSVDANKNIIAEKIELERLLAIAKDEKRSKEERLAAIKKLNEINPEYLGGLTLETINTDKAKQATDKYIQSLLLKAKIEAAKEKLIEVEKELIDVQQNGAAATVEWYQQAWNYIKSGGNVAIATAYNAATSVDNTIKATDELMKKQEALTQFLNDAEKGNEPKTSTGNPEGEKTEKLKGELLKRVQLYHQYVDSTRSLDKALTDDEDKELDKHLKKMLEDRKKYLQDTLIIGMSETEKENNEYAERLKKLGLFWVTKQNKTREELLKEGKITQDQNKALEICEKEHNDNLEKISTDLKNKKKADQDKWNKEILQTNKETNAQILEALEMRYLSEIEAAGNNEELRKQIDEKYARDKLTIELGQLESTKQLLIGLGESTVEIDQQIAEKKKQILDSELQTYQEHLAVRKEYNLVSLAEQEADEIARLEEHYKNKELTTAEHEQALLDIKLKYASEYISKYLSIVSNLSDAITGFQNAELTNLQTQKEKELAIAGDNADKKKAIEDKYGKEEKAIKKKYADKIFAMQVAQIIGSTAQAAIEAYKAMAGIPYVGPALGAVAAGVAIAYGAARIAEAKAQRDAVKQLAKGQIPVIGADDGKPYNLPYAGRMRTGIYPRPVIVSEKGGEMVVDAETTSDLVVNYPGIVKFIRGLASKRIPQYAEGNYPPANNQQSATDNTDQLVQLIAANTVVMNRLNDRLNQPIEAEVVMDKFARLLDQYNKLKSDVTQS